MNRMIPKPTEALLLGNGLINPIWWRYLQGLSGDQSVAGLQAQITELARRIAAIGAPVSVLGTMSVKAVDQPDGSVVLSLDGDALHVGSNAFYSTDHAGRKRWAPLSQSIQGGGGIVFTDSGYTVMGAVDSDEDLPPTGNPGEAWWVGNILYAWNDVDGEWQPDYEPSGVLALELEDVTPEVGGTLQKTAFDAKGRRTHEDAATTDDLPEGVSNLYFTDARAIAAVGAVSGGEILVQDGSSAPPVMLTNEAEDDFIYSG